MSGLTFEWEWCGPVLYNVRHMKMDANTCSQHNQTVSSVPLCQYTILPFYDILRGGRRPGSNSCVFLVSGRHTRQLTKHISERLPQLINVNTWITYITARAMWITGHDAWDLLTLSRINARLPLGSAINKEREECLTVYRKKRVRCPAAQTRKTFPTKLISWTMHPHGEGNTSGKQVLWHKCVGRVKKWHSDWMECMPSWSMKSQTWT
jgi:hypothetical protein